MFLFERSALSDDEAVVVPFPTTAARLRGRNCRARYGGHPCAMVSEPGYGN